MWWGRESPELAAVCFLCLADAGEEGGVSCEEVVCRGYTLCRGHVVGDEEGEVSICANWCVWWTAVVAVNGTDARALVVSVIAENDARLSINDSAYH